MAVSCSPEFLPRRAEALRSSLEGQSQNRVPHALPPCGLAGEGWDGGAGTEALGWRCWDGSTGMEASRGRVRAARTEGPSWAHSSWASRAGGGDGMCLISITVNV